MTTFFTIDYVTAIAIKKPITFEHGRAFYNNPIAIAEGDPTAPVKVAIVKSPDGILPAQTAVATDETDTFKRLAPNGTGGVVWKLPLEGSTVGLSANSDTLTNTLLNAGLWLVQIHAFTIAGGTGVIADVGYALLLNGAILLQSQMTISNAGPSSAISSSAFSVSGSGASKSIVAGVVGTTKRITAARLA